VPLYYTSLEIEWQLIKGGTSEETLRLCLSLKNNKLLVNNNYFKCIEVLSSEFKTYYIVLFVYYYWIPQNLKPINSNFDGNIIF